MARAAKVGEAAGARRGAGAPREGAREVPRPGEAGGEGRGEARPRDEARPPEEVRPPEERPDVRPSAANAPFDAIGLGKALLRNTRAGSLATVDTTGTPFSSLVTVATDLDGTPLFLVSQLSTHTQNLDRDPRTSLLLSRLGRGDPLAHPRLTLVGRAERVAGADLPRVRARFLARHPKAELYVDFPDFGFVRFAIGAGYLNGGFARAASLAASDLLVPAALAEALAEGEPGAVAHMNADHSDALSLYATALAGEAPGRWRCTGLDPEGIDLVAGESGARVLFPEPVANPGALRAALVALAGSAREKGARGGSQGGLDDGVREEAPQRREAPAGP